ncbi:MAG: helix-turn-helix transcriptional regulator [Muribaculaceae bacterium]|nr:helix-turn-helix transcriptional regulator [Muribaculaceae bacterium]
MINFGESFQLLLEKGHMSAETVAHELGCSKSYIYQLKNKDSIDYSLLEKICRIFKVSPLMFFDREVCHYGLIQDGNVTNNEYSNTSFAGHATMNIGFMDDIRNLKEKLEEKERLIAEKERLIQLLLNGKGNLNLV